MQEQIVGVNVGGTAWSPSLAGKNLIVVLYRTYGFCQRWVIWYGWRTVLEIVL